MGFKPTSPPSIGCYVTGLKVHNALWDTSLSTIRSPEVNDIPSTNELPLLHLIPKSKDCMQEKTAPVFKCAVVRSEEDLLDNTSANHVINIEVPVQKERDVQELLERKVYISTSLKPVS